MSTIRATYEQLARPWTHKELADRFDQAKRHAAQLSRPDPEDRAQTPVAILASAIPALAALNVAIHVIHALPDTADPALLDQLLLNAETNAAVAAQRMHRALELDGVTHNYTTDEWLPAVYDVAARLLESARLDCEPPSLVEEANASVRWLSQAIIDLDQDAPDATAAVVDGLGRVLTFRVFGAVARQALDV
jgi:hypothetical protein